MLSTVPLVMFKSPAVDGRNSCLIKSRLTLNSEDAFTGPMFSILTDAFVSFVSRVGELNLAIVRSG